MWISIMWISPQSFGESCSSKKLAMPRKRMLRYFGVSEGSRRWKQCTLSKVETMHPELWVELALETLKVLHERAVSRFYTTKDAGTYENIRQRMRSSVFG